MDEALSKLDAGKLLFALESNRHITSRQREQLADRIRRKETSADLPYYLRLLAGIGAFIATGCLLGFLALTKVIAFDNAAEAMGWGGMLIACGIVLARTAAIDAGIALHSFLMQTSFCLVGAGKLLAICGIVGLFPHDYRHNGGELWNVAFALAAVTALTWPFYDVFIDRFICSAATLLTAMSAIIVGHAGSEMTEFLLNGLLVAELCIAGFIFTSGRAGRSLAPLGYALLSAITVIVSFLSVDGIRDLPFHAPVFSPAFANIALAAALVGLIGWAAGDLKRLSQEPLLIASAGAGMLGFIATPGITLGLGLMILGYARLSRRLLAYGGLLTAAFLCIYYYSLALTLFEKSGVLVASGLLLLAGYGYMRFRKLDKEA